jgi:hypothetical protein
MFIAPDTPSSHDLLHAGRQYTASAMMVASVSGSRRSLFTKRHCRSGVVNIDKPVITIDADPSREGA